MAKTSQLQVRIDPEDKKKAQLLFKQYGLSTSAAISMFIDRSLRENRIPFSIGPQDTSANRQ